MKKKYISYKDSGVNINKGDLFVEGIQKKVKGIGGFSGSFTIPKEYKNPVLFASTDGVGTKLLVAKKMNKHDTVGIDLVAMVVNDLIVCGAKPLIFLDYYATGELSLKDANEIMKGILKGCEMADCRLAGGETAELPGLYAKGDYDLAGFGIGVADRNKIIDGKDIKEGDSVIGLASNGIHSNGLSLARKVLIDKFNYPLRKKHPLLEQSIGETLMTPTKIYVKTFLKLMNKFKIKGAAHITGSGIMGNLPRVFPNGLGAEIYKNSWEVPKIYQLIQSVGPVSEKEMFNTFNMGIGMIIIVSTRISNDVIKYLKIIGEKAYKIGKIIKGNGIVRLK